MTHRPGFGFRAGGRARCKCPLLALGRHRLTHCIVRFVVAIDSLERLIARSGSANSEHDFGGKTSDPGFAASEQACCLREDDRMLTVA